MLRKPIGEYFPGVWMMDTPYIGNGEFRRRLPITIFYPSDQTGKEVPYLSGGYYQDLMQSREPKNDVRTYCYQEVPLSKKEKVYPVIIYSHGLDGYRMDSTLLCADLASKGYIVVSIGHPYGAQLERYTDGTYCGGWKERFGDIPESTMGENLKLLLLMCPIIPVKKRVAAWERYCRKFAVIQKNLIPLWEEDLTAGLDYVEWLSSTEGESQFYGRMNLTGGIPMIGMSLGGNTVVGLSLKEPRIPKAVNLDGGLFTELGVPSNTPQILVYCQKVNLFAYLRLRGMNYTKLTVRTLRGVNHWQFADGVYLSEKGKKRPMWAERVSREKAIACLEFLQEK